MLKMFRCADREHWEYSESFIDKLAWGEERWHRALTSVSSPSRLPKLQYCFMHLFTTASFPLTVANWS